MSVETEPRPEPGVFLRQLFEGSPFHQHMGFELIDVSKERLSVRVRSKPELRSGRNSLHGGAVAAVVDTIGAFHAGVAARNHPSNAAGERTFRVATVDLHVDYLRPLVGESFLATTSVLHAGASLVRVRAEITNDDNGVVAVASANYAY